MNTRRVVRITGTLMLVGGVAVLAWVLVVWRWQDPFTALYTHLEATPAQPELRAAGKGLPPAGAESPRPPRRPW